MNRIVFVFLSVSVFVSQTNGNTNQEEKELGDLTFVCKDGWKILESDCYSFVNVSMAWHDASQACQRQGSSLLWLRDKIEYDKLLEIFPSRDMFWTGLHSDSNGEAFWSEEDNPVKLRTIPLWDNEEPSDSMSTTCAVAKSQNGMALQSCNHRLPFVCKYHACFKGEHMCATGRRCYTEADRCDGRFDCEDQSDERDCPTKYCNHYFKLSKVSGAFTTERISDGTKCMYMLESATGDRIKLRMTGATIEANTAFIEVWTGGPDLRHSKLLARLTGEISPTSFISLHNYITVLVIGGDITTLGPLISFSWTTEIPEIKDDRHTISASSRWEALTSPFIDEPWPTLQLQQKWIIEAPQGEVIAYYVESFVMSDQASLQIQEGILIDDFKRIIGTDNVKVTYFVSAARYLQVHWNSGSGNSSFTLKYKTGCSMEIDAAYGLITPPVMWATREYPSQLTCIWMLTASVKEKEVMYINIFNLDLDKDPRTNPQSNDTLKVTDDTSSTYIDTESILWNSDLSVLRIEFKSDRIINTGIGFEAVFSLGCPDLQISNQTRRNPEAKNIPFGTNVTFTCKTGYRFNSEEYYDYNSIALECLNGGIWSYQGNTDIRIPNCEEAQCGFPDEIQNGFIKNVTRTSYGGIAEYQCNDGLNLTHTDDVVCGPDGTWHNVPTCHSVTCPAAAVENIEHGYHEIEAGNSFTNNSADFGTVVTFVCHSGYELKGSYRSYCRDEGWSDPKPECIRIQCPDPVIADGDSFHWKVYYDDVVVRNCPVGYTASKSEWGHILLRCGAYQTYAQCKDIDDCENNPCNHIKSRCINTPGSYYCECLEGYEPMRGNGHNECQDIDECSIRKGGCSSESECFNTEGSYECHCNTGWTLFTEDGTSGFYIPEGETGSMPDDVYRYNHTCVKKTCDAGHDSILSYSKTLFHYGDNELLVCDDGYHITGRDSHATTQIIHCTENGWDLDNVSCTARTCSTDSPPPHGSYDRTTVNFNEVVELTCMWTETVNKTRSARCIYDNGTTRFGGDDITYCPELKCDDLDAVLPEGAIIPNAVSLEYLDHQSFGFDCKPGFILQGTSESNDTTVTCKENGRWSLYTLTCLAPRCSDPGTPAEARQVVINYEDGQTLSYVCDRTGFEPEPDLTYTCQYNESTNSAVWTNDLANYQPVCKDKAKPVIENLPSSMIVFRKAMEKVNVSPGFSDNVGLKHTSASNHIQPDDIISESLNVTYTAEDFEGNVETQTVIIEVIGGKQWNEFHKEVSVIYSNDTSGNFPDQPKGQKGIIKDRRMKPSLACDSRIFMVDQYSPDELDVRELATSDSEMTFSQNFVTRSFLKIGSYDIINVTAKNNFGTESYCSLLVHFKAGRCFTESVYPDANAVRSCSDSHDFCTSTCKDGYIYGDGEPTKNFTCTGFDNWDFDYPYVLCLPAEIPTCWFQVTVIHDFGYPSMACENEYNSAINSNLTTFQSNIYTLCKVSWAMQAVFAVARNGSTEFVSKFSIKLMSRNALKGDIESCLNTISSNKAIFSLPGNQLYCRNAIGAKTLAIVVKSLNTSTAMFDCAKSTYSLLDSLIGIRCVPCGPGQFYQSGSCTSCGEGFYQTGADGTCQKCDQGQTSSAAGTGCISKCPPGFWSVDGILPCDACPYETYWSDAKTCLPCPMGTSTAGHEGALSCFHECPPSQYSLSGYDDVPCKQCPQHFIQPSSGQTTCKECAQDQVTEVGADQGTFASCKPYPFQQDCHNSTKPIDILFILDASGSVGSSNFNTMLNFVEKMVDGFLISSSRTQVGLITFASSVVLQFHLNRYHAKNDIKNAVSQTRYTSGGTDTAAALGYARTTSFQTQNGMRENAAHIAVVVTDGGSNNNAQTKLQASNLRRHGVTVFSVGVGSGYNLAELNAIATDPDATHVLTVNSFSALDTIEETLAERTCEGEKCDRAFCSGHGSCSFEHHRPVCTCDDGYRGGRCENSSHICDNHYSPCLNGGTCVHGTTYLDYTCGCREGFTGTHCEKDLINDCATTDCSEAAMCMDKVKDYECLCPTVGGYQKPNCVQSGNLCDSSPCQHGTCNNLDNIRYECTCHTGYAGVNCNQSTIECEADTCLYGGTCEDLVNGFKCHCVQGFSGVNCEITPDFCSGKDCQGGRCISSLDKFTGICLCNAPWYEDTVADTTQPPSYTTTAPEPTCQNSTSPADILFILDASGSVGETNFKTMLDFVKKMVDGFPIGANETQVGVITFDSQVYLQFHLNRYHTKTDIKNAVSQTRYTKGGTNTADAIRYAKESAFTPQNGMRSNAVHIAIIVTDGQSNSMSNTSLEAANLRNAGVTVFSIGVGSGANENELKAMATDPDVNHVFTVTTFTSLDNITGTLAQKTCQAADTTLPPIITTTTPEPTCQNNTSPADILFILDASGSVGETNFNTMLDFVKKMVDGFPISSNETQVGVITFDSQVYLQFHLNRYHTKSNIKNAVSQTRYTKGGTNTADAIRYARETAFSPQNGMRSDAAHIAIIVTDGQSSSMSNTTSEAAKLRGAGVTVFSIGVGSGANEQELKAMATDPDDTHVFTVSNFTSLDNITGTLAQKTCQVADTTQPPINTTTPSIPTANTTRPSINTTTSPEPTCQNSTSTDILFILDASGSVGETNFKTMLDFVTTMVDRFPIGVNGTQVGVITFDSIVYLQFHLNRYHTKIDIENAVSQTRYTKGGTNTADAIRYARETAFTTQNGMRPNASHIAIIVTDGQSSSMSDTTSEAAKLRDAGITVFSIGVGSGANEQELKAMATDPDDTHVFTVTNFTSLDNITGTLAQKTCQAPDTTKPSINTTTASKPTCWNSTSAADILFILDASGSVGENNFKTMLDFVENMVDEFSIGANKTQVGVITFDGQVYLQFHLNRYHTKTDIKNAVSQTRYTKGETNTADAIRYARETAFTPQNGMRPIAAHIAIIVTDGQSNSMSDTTSEAAKLRDAGVTVFSIGVGSGANEQELKAMATDPDVTHVFTVTNFTSLYNITGPLAQETCQVADYTQPPINTTTAPEPTCQNSTSPADILFILDASGSVLAANFKTILDFVEKMVDGFSIGANETQVGLITFASNVDLQFHLNRYHTKTEIKIAVSQTRYTKGGTNTADAIRYARGTAFTLKNGMRPYAAHIAIIVTDGQSNSMSDTSSEAAKLRDAGVTVFSIGVGSDANEQELKTMATDPDRTHVFTVTNFTSLDNITGALAQKTCQAADATQATINTTTPEATCQNNTSPADILFILDASGSVGETNFNTMLDFVEKMVDGFSIGANETQVGLITFASSVNKQFHLNRFHTKTDIKYAVSQARYTQGGTHTADAIRYARETAFTPQNGMRPNAAHIAIIVTDGQSNSMSNTTSEAAKLRDAGVTVFSIGVGSGANEEELKAMATDPDDTHVFTVTDFTSLDNITGTLAQTTCQVADITQPPLNTTTAPEPYCQNNTSPADILFILDASGSVRETNFKIMLDFVKKMVDGYTIGAYDTQVGVITFASQVALQFHLNRYHSKTDIKNAVSQTRYTQGGANTADAIRYARETSFTPQNGKRPHAAQIALIVTDGQSNSMSDTTSEAAKLRDAGVTVFSIGVGSSANEQELKAMATDPDVTHVFSVTNFISLNTITRTLAQETCQDYQEKHKSMNEFEFHQIPSLTTELAVLEQLYTTLSPVADTTEPPINTTTAPEPNCQNNISPADILFILDASGSVEAANFKTVLDFVKKIVDGYPIGANETQFGLITFDSQVYLQFHLNRYHNKTDIKNAVSQTRYTKGGTNTADAIRYARETAFTLQNGMRPNSARIALIVTDGQSRSMSDTASEAAKLRDAGVTVFSIGVGSIVNEEELKAMSTDPDDTHVFTVSNFTSLVNITGTLAQKTCEVLPVYMCKRSLVQPCDFKSCVNGTCHNNEADHTATCECDPGFMGSLCQYSIDDCTDQSCVNGDCVDGHMSTTCKCWLGFEGEHCEQNIDDCADQCGVTNGTGQCVDDVDGYHCVCEPGYTGADCETEINECDALPCQHDGTCEDKLSGYECKCPLGWTGANCESWNDQCTPNQCQNQGDCYSLNNTFICRCHGGTQGDLCQGLRSICDALSHVEVCINGGDCIVKGGSAACSCPIDYVGDSCELTKDWCLRDPCKNGGTCTNLEPRGFRCDCAEGYSGSTCEVVANACLNNPCPDTARCQSMVTDFICMCPMGRQIVGRFCRTDVSRTDFILLLNNIVDDVRRMIKRSSQGSRLALHEDVPTLITPFRMSGYTFSVMMWARIHQSLEMEPCNILRLIGSRTIYPLEAEPLLVLTITSQGVTLLYDHSTVSLPFEISLDVNNDWNHIGVSLSADKYFSFTVNAIEVPELVQLPEDVDIDLNGVNAQLIFGDTDLVVEYKNVTVWETSLLNSDFARVLEDDNFVPDGIMIQGWWNIKHTKATQLLTQELTGEQFRVDKSLPEINCGTNAYEKTSTEKVLRLSSLNDLTQRIHAVSRKNAVRHSIPKDLTWGYYSAVLSVEGKNKRHAECRFPIYIKYNDRCPSPVDDSDVVTMPCDDTDQDGVCRLECQDPSRFISVPTPHFRPCSALGVFDWQHPYQKLVLPTCAVGAAPKQCVKSMMQFAFHINCQTVKDINENVQEDIKDEIRQIFRGLNQDWQNICNGQNCTNLLFSPVECDPRMPNRINLEISLCFGSENLTTTNGGSLRLDDALKSIIILEKKIDLSRFATAELLVSSVEVTMVTQCLRSTDSLINGVCVPCGRGFVKSNESGSCEPCPLGSYKGDGDISCVPCNNGLTTYRIGAPDPSLCLAKCEAGTFFNETSAACEECPMHRYQDKTGQLYCEFCEVNFKTKEKGAKQKSDCKEDCPAGQERNATGVCMPCGRGNWRDILEDDCQPCDVGWTTRPEEVAVSKETCSMGVCPVGSYWNDVTVKCEPCPLGRYQDEIAMLECEPCEGNKTTKLVGANRSDDCVSICAGGHEYSTTEMKCVACGVGTYKPGEDRFGNCTDCPANFTTDGNMKTSETDCDIPLCGMGHYVKDKVCTACDLDTYQPDLHPAAGVACTECPMINGVETGTNDLGAESKEACELICPGGKEYNEDFKRCDPCSVGKYKPSESRFGSCLNCTSGYTTDGGGKMLESDCNIRNCPPGTYVDGENCIPCDLGFYQNDWRKNECKPCGENRNTSRQGAKSISECQVFCGAGEQSSPSEDYCEPCPAGKFKPSASYDQCTDCPTDRTSNDERTACSVYHCGMGKEYKVLSIVGEACIQCQPGTYKDTVGNKACKPCQPGYTSVETGQASCDILHCVPGKTKFSGQCVLCDVGTYKEDAGNTACTNCSSIRTTVGKGSISQADCNIVVCEAGQYRDPSQTANCTECALNYYQNNRGQTSCIYCGVGKVTMATATVDSTDCVDECQKGEEYMSNSRSCDQCPQRYYKDTVGNTASCRQCPPGFTTPGKGAQSPAECKQIECSAGQYWLESAKNCVDCPRDSYQNESAQSECKSCPDNTYSDDEGAASSTTCKSYCETNPTYCNNHGTCYDTGRRTASCWCYDGFFGNQCANKETPSSSTSAMIGGVIGGGTGLLVLILLVVGIIKFVFRRRSQKAMDEPEFFRNPIYEQQGGIGHYTGSLPSFYAGAPAVAYYPTYDNYSSARKHSRYDQSHETDDSIWQA